MNREDIISMALEAELIYTTHGRLWMDAGEPGEELERFSALVAAASASVEREACAKVCEELETCSDAEFYGYEFAKAIRARGQA